MAFIDSSSGGVRRHAGAFLVVLAGLMLLGSAAAKLAHLPQAVDGLRAMGFDGGRLAFVATLEIASALLFLFRPTRSIGLLLASAYMGGAIATHLQHGMPIVMPAVFLAVIWLGAWLRHPEVLWSAGSSSLEPGWLVRRDGRHGVSEGS